MLCVTPIFDNDKDASHSTERPEQNEYGLAIHGTWVNSGAGHRKGTFIGGTKRGSEVL